MIVCCVISKLTVTDINSQNRTSKKQFKLAKARKKVHTYTGESGVLALATQKLVTYTIYPVAGMVSTSEPGPSVGDATQAVVPMTSARPLPLATVVVI